MGHHRIKFAKIVDGSKLQNDNDAFNIARNGRPVHTYYPNYQQ